MSLHRKLQSITDQICSRWAPVVVAIETITWTLTDPAAGTTSGYYPLPNNGDFQTKRNDAFFAAYLGAVIAVHLFNCFWGDEMLKTLIQSNRSALKDKRLLSYWKRKKKKKALADKHALTLILLNVFQASAALCKNYRCGLLTHWTAGMDSERLSNES